MFLSEADRMLSSSPAVFVASPAQETEKDISPAERERVRRLIHRLHVSGGHVSKTSLRLLLQRRGCPVWMQHMVDQLQCDWCLEVSLATPPKLWQAVKVDIFELEDSQRQGFFALYMDAACKLWSCSCFLEGNRRQRFEPNGATLISHLAKDWMQHFPQFQFLISDPGGCFVSNELREWASVRGIGLLTAPGEFHGLTADLENLIRVIERSARILADDHPSLKLASCVSLACFSHNNGFKTGGYSPVQWAFGADNEGTVSQRRCPLRLRLKNRRKMPSIAPNTRLAGKTSIWNLEPGSCTFAGTCPCHHDRGHSTMVWIGAFHDRTNWCCLVIARKQADQMFILLSSVDAEKERNRLPLRKVWCKFQHRRA